MLPVFDLLQRINRSDFPFLVVGGHAVILHGIPRFTRDLDLLIPENSIESWLTLLGKLGYQSYHRSEAFVQLEASAQGALPPVDLMIVDSTTWSKLLEKSLEQNSGAGGVLPVPHPWHLIAMKLQAASAPTRRGSAVDWSDILQLILSCSINIADPEFRAIVLKYGGDSALQRIDEAK